MSSAIAKICCYYTDDHSFFVDQEGTKQPLWREPQVLDVSQEGVSVSYDAIADIFKLTHPNDRQVIHALFMGDQKRTWFEFTKQDMPKIIYGIAVQERQDFLYGAKPATPNNRFRVIAGNTRHLMINASGQKATEDDIRIYGLDHAVVALWNAHNITSLRQNNPRNNTQRFFQRVVSPR